MAGLLYNTGIVMFKKQSNFAGKDAILKMLWVAFAQNINHSNSET